MCTPSSPLAPKPSSRHRLAEAQRAEMRRRLIESAILVFAARGPGGVVIRDVIATADVARGSFYNHFRSTEELMEAACLEITREVLHEIEPIAAKAQTAAEALHIGTILALQVSRHHPVFGQFLAQLSLQAHTLLAELSHLLPDRIAAGIAAGEFVEDDPRAMADLTVGMLRQVSLRLVHHPKRPEDAEAFLRAASRLILRGLGVAHDRAEGIVNTPLPDITLPAHSLLHRAQTRHSDAQHQPLSSPREER